eukprot:snap_masked-scaffold_20-processed-gene-4.19-mRNA-1 protein AED:1.00 eAED:1.00 QI:0/-1/0/0/-1/1/1/0/375
MNGSKEEKEGFVSRNNDQINYLHKRSNALVIAVLFLLLAGFSTIFVSQEFKETRELHQPIYIQNSSIFSILKVQKETLGEVTATAVSHSGDLLYILCRRQNTFDSREKIQSAVLVFNISDYKIVFQHYLDNSSFVVPHGISVDEEGSVYVVDSSLNSIFKFNKFDHLEWILRADTTNSTYFNKPADIAVFQNKIYISDGYVNNHVLVFSSNRTLQQEIGAGMFQVVHSIDVDVYNNIYVADREHSLIRIFQKSGILIKSLHPVFTRISNQNRIERDREYARDVSAVSYLYVNSNLEFLFSIEGEFLVIRKSEGMLKYSIIDFFQLPAHSWPHDVATKRFATVGYDNVLRLRLFVACLDMQDALVYDFTYPASVIP